MVITFLNKKNSYKKQTQKTQISLQQPFILKINYIKKHTYESENTWNNLFVLTLSRIF